MYQILRRADICLHSAPCSSMLLLWRTSVGESQHFSSSSRSLGGSPLFHLASLSNSREGRWLKNASGLSPIEHSTQLQLLRAEAELDTKSSKNSDVKQASFTLSRAKRRMKLGEVAVPKWKEPSSVTDESTFPRIARQFLVSNAQALQIGQAVLDRHAKQRQRWKTLLRRKEDGHRRDVVSLHTANRRLEKENKAGSVWILLCTGLATSLAVWKVSPPVERPQPAGDVEQDSSADMSPIAIPLESAALEKEPDAPIEDVVIPNVKLEERQSRNWFWARTIKHSS